MANDELISEVRDLIAREVTTGFASEDEIREQALELAAEEGEEPESELLDRIDDMLEKAMDDHARAQESWDGTTDCDRLDAAFRDLERSGVVARQNWTCCQTCGLSEMRGEVHDHSRGYVFYHQQDTEAALETGTLYLAYGACSDDREEQLAVAREIASTLARHGLKVEWSGSLERRILVNGISWRRRRA